MTVKKKILTILGLVLIIIAVWNLLRPLPKITPLQAAIDVPQPAAVSLPWPAAEAAIGTTQDGLLETHGDMKPLPIASTAKVITALSILQQKPLSAGRQGPSITLKASDVAIYHQYVAEDGSVVPVQAGQQISEYEALQAMMLPSANNIADTMAIWAFGSLSAYTNYANNFVKSLGMSQTTISDASGFSPSTVSTAADLFRLAQAALANPVLSDIVDQRLAQTSAFGTIYNINTLIGIDGIVGIKTGNTDQAGGCFMFAAKHTIKGQDRTIIGAVVGDSSLYAALGDGQNLIEQADANFRLVEPVKAGQVVATYKTAWGSSQAVAQKDVKLLVWQDKMVSITKSLSQVRAPVAAGRAVGTLKFSAGNQSQSTTLVMKSGLPGPSLTWRLTHF